MSLTPACGELVFVMAPSVGYAKYHLCLGQNAHGIHVFLFLNSENGYVGDLVFPCAAFPTLPGSRTGQTVVSFSVTPLFSHASLDLYGATSFGPIDKAVAQALRAHLETVRALPRPDKAFVRAALDSLV